jgi:RNA polymerase sigma-70 factor (ECF subfamily)
MDSPNDAGPACERLLTAARQGDEAAWNELVARFRPELVRLAAERLRGARVDPSGVVQEALLKAWLGHAQMEARSEEQFMNWLKVIVLNSGRDAARGLLRGKRDVSRDSPLPESSAGDLAGPLTGPSTAAIRREEQDQVQAWLGQLSEREQAIVRLRITEQRSWEAIGAELKSSAGAVEQAYYRALRRLKQNAGEASA